MTETALPPWYRGTGRKLLFVTGTRAEYGLLRWVIHGVQDAPVLQLRPGRGRRPRPPRDFAAPRSGSARFHPHATIEEARRQILARIRREEAHTRILGQCPLAGGERQDGVPGGMEGGPKRCLRLVLARTTIRCLTGTRFAGYRGRCLGRGNAGWSFALLPLRDRHRRRDRDGANRLNGFRTGGARGPGKKQAARENQSGGS